MVVLELVRVTVAVVVVLETVTPVTVLVVVVLELGARSGCPRGGSGGGGSDTGRITEAAPLPAPTALPSHTLKWLHCS